MWITTGLWKNVINPDLHIRRVQAQAIRITTNCTMERKAHIMGWLALVVTIWRIRLESEHSVYQVWLPVIGKALSYLSLHSAEMGDKTIAEKAMFLEGLGVGRRDVAEMLGTSYASLSELLRQARSRRKGGKKNGSRKQKAR
jgi:hypothetical protein